MIFQQMCGLFLAVSAAVKSLTAPLASWRVAAFGFTCFFFRPLDVKFHRPQNISGSRRRKSDAAFSETTEVDGGPASPRFPH